MMAKTLEEAHKDITEMIQKAIDHPGDHTASGCAYHVMLYFGCISPADVPERDSDPTTKTPKTPRRQQRVDDEPV